MADDNPTPASTHPALEKHWSVAEIAELWGVSTDTVIHAFQDEPGVLRFGSDESRYRRKRIILRIPQSIVLRVHEQRTRKASSRIR